MSSNAALTGTTTASSSVTGQNKLSREEFKKQKILEEQRKAGTLPAEVDPETGLDINPHIPQYISQAPWYLGIDHATLKHQRSKNESKVSIPLSEQEEAVFRQKGLRLSSSAPTKFRKGACENCGAMSHKLKDCMERPRKKGAKWTGQDLQADEVVIGDRDLGFEAKRDRWSGYDTTQHLQLNPEWEAIEERRRQIREEKIKEKLEADSHGNAPVDAAATGTKRALGDDSSDDEDDDKYADHAEAVGQKVDTKNRQTVRNLRIREDTAKYLRNLDVNSAYYDPKTRSMRTNPYGNKDPSEVEYAGDNFYRYSGETSHIAQLQGFAWDAETRGKGVHLQANPTQGQLLYEEFKKKKAELTETQKDSILAKYGGEEHLDAPPKELLLAQSEQYVEYSQTGRLIKGQEKAKVKSRYTEDMYPMNHTSVWGSYWTEGKWGYACCQQTMRMAYCTGSVTQ